MNYKITVDIFNKMINNALETEKIKLDFDIRKCKKFELESYLSCEVVINGLYFFFEPSKLLINDVEYTKNYDIYLELEWKNYSKLVDGVLEDVNYAGVLLNYNQHEIKELIFNEEMLKIIHDNNFIITQHPIVGLDT